MVAMSSFVQSTFQPRAVVPNNVPVLLDCALSFVTPELSACSELWNEKRSDKLMPARAQFSMRELKGVLRNLVLMDLVGSGEQLRFKVRYMGSELDEQLIPMTGHFADEILPTYFMEKWKTVWTPPVEQKRAMRSLSRAEFRDRDYSLVEGFYAPLAEDDGVPNVLMIAVFYHGFDSADTRTRQRAEQLMDEFNRRTVDRA
jgi:hypothetical protein